MCKNLVFNVHQFIICIHACSMALWMAHCLFGSGLVGGVVHHSGPDWIIWTATGGTALEFRADIHSLQRMNPIDIGKPPDFPCRATSGMTFLAFGEVSWRLLDGLALRINYSNCGHPLTFHLATSLGEIIICPILKFFYIYICINLIQHSPL